MMLLQTNNIYAASSSDLYVRSKLVKVWIYLDKKYPDLISKLYAYALIESKICIKVSLLT